jgi:hypothetical protein
MPHLPTSSTENDDDIIADGGVVRVPMVMMDAAQREVRRHFARRSSIADAVTDALRYAGHRPGYVADVAAPLPTPIRPARTRASIFAARRVIAGGARD